MLNCFTFSGRITRDIEPRKTATGKSVTTVTVANETGWGENKKTHFFDVVLFEKKADYAAQYGQKGQMVEVSGELHQRKYADRDGNNRTVFEVQQVRTFDLVPTGQRAKPEQGLGNFSEDLADIPF